MTGPYETIPMKHNITNVEVLAPSDALDRLLDAFSEHELSLNPLRFSADANAEQTAELIRALADLSYLLDVAMLSAIGMDRQLGFHTYAELSELSGKAVPTVHRWADLAHDRIRNALRHHGFRLKHNTRRDR